jgi:hypothetical protein
MSSTEPEQVMQATDEPRSRRDLLRASGVAAVAGILGALGISNATEARNGSAVRMGQRNTGSRTTVLESSKGPVLVGRISKSGSKAVAVQGAATAKSGKAVAVQGTAASPDAVAGQFEAADGGTAVEASAAGKRGVALRTKGRLQFDERSGTAKVSAGGADFIIPVAGGLSASSVVLATMQDHFPGVHVEAASVQDAEEGLIVVRLSQAVPEAATVAWIVLD